MQLTLVTLHVLYGQETERIDELFEIARWLEEWAENERQWNQNLITLGDFNIDRRGDPLFDAFTSTGLRPAPELNEVPGRSSETQATRSSTTRSRGSSSAVEGPC